MSALLDTNMNHIANQIYLGDLWDGFACDFDTLYVHEQEYAKNYKPTYHVPILTIVSDRPLMAMGHAHFVCTNEGMPKLASIEALTKCAEIIERHATTDKPLLVHCHGGIERSPLTVAWWLSTSDREDGLDAAYRLIRGKRPIIEDRRYWLER